jgi:hypothetical protein
VNVTQMQFINLNSTVEVQVSATSNGTIQGEVQLSPYGTGLSSQDLYLPSGKYSWNYTELNTPRDRLSGQYRFRQTHTTV